MTIDEAICHAEKVAEENYGKATEYQYQCSELSKCLKCGDEHMQLAEWLKDYKRLKEQESCEDAISRQAVLSYIYNDLGLGDEENGADIERQMELERSYKYVKSLPSVKPQERTGHWNLFHITEHGMREDSYFKCNRCNYESYKEYNFCPDCGAKMEVENNG